MHEITCIIPAYTLNEDLQQLTQNAVNGISGTPLIIVDNASPMGGGYLRSKADIYVRNRHNRNYAGAVNQGIKLATTKYVAVVSTDTIPSPNWKKVVEEVMTPECFSLHFRMTNYDVPFVMGNKTWKQGKERWCTAAFFVLDREKALRDDLLFDEQFKNSFEDFDLFLRVKEKGYSTAYTTRACYQHRHSATQQVIGFTGTKENKIKFMQKWNEDPDDLLQRLYPEQMNKPYWEGFNQL